MTNNAMELHTIFTSIYLENFKTYPRILLTEMECDNIFAIIGGNGNGKSNLIDAFLYGLGESSLEKLRVRTLKELIHHNANRCIVKIVLTVDKSTLLTFERCTTRGGSSVYYFNNKKVTANAYIEELRKCGVDVNAKAFAVQQGTVQEVALKDGRELMEFFEKISGSYNFKLEYDAKQKETLELLEKFMNLKRTVARHTQQRKKVKQSRASIQKLNEISTQIEDLNIKINLIQLLHLNQDVDKHDINKRKLNDTIEKLTRELEGHKAAFIANQTQVTETNVELHHQMPELELRNQKYQSADMDANNVKQEMNALLDQIKSIETGISMQDNIIQNEAVEINKLEEELQKAVAEVTSTPDVTLSESQIQDFNMKNEYLTIKQRITDIIAEREDLPHYEDTNREQYNRIVIEAEQFRNTKKIKFIEAEEKALMRQTDELTEDIIDIAAKERELQEIELRYNIARNRVEQITTSTTINGSSQHLDCSVIGRLSNLYTLKSSVLQNAINTTFGSTVQAIIVKDADTIVEFIANRDNFPKEMFIPLNKIQYKVERTDQEAILIKDSLKYEHRFESVFNNVSKNVAIIDGPPTSDIISRKFGVVTKKGTFYSKNGFVKSIKYDKRSQGGTENMEQLLTDYREIRSELQEKQIELALLKQKHYEFEITKEICSKNKQQPRLEELREQRSLIQQENEELARQLNESEVRAEQNKKSIETIENDLFKDFCAQYNFENIQIYEQIIDPNYITNNQNKMKVTELNGQIDRLRTKISRVQERKQELIRILKSLNTNKRDCDNNLNNITAYWEECSTNLNQVKSTVTDLQTRLTNLDKEKKRLGKTISSTEAKIKDSNQSLTKALIEKSNNLQKRHKCLLKCKVNNIKLPTTDGSSASQYLENETDIDTLHSIESSLPLDFNSLPREIQRATSLHTVLQQLENDLKSLTTEQTKLQTISQSLDQSLLDMGNEQTALNLEFENMRKGYNKCTEELNIIENKRSELLQHCLDFVVLKIDSVYKKLYGNGQSTANATCIYERQKEMFLGPVHYICTVPQKHPYPMNLLSTGEKTMASLALICTLLLYQKLSLVVFDEVDCSLDPEKLASFLKYLNEFKQTRQLMLITHNAQSMVESDEIIGVTRNFLPSTEEETRISGIVRVQLERYLPSHSDSSSDSQDVPRSPSSLSSTSSMSIEY